jgi:MFS superfamily sulfate permease-like transporter
MLLAVSLFFVFLFGSSLVYHVPTVIVGSMLFYLFLQLSKECFYDTLSNGISRMEYFTILFVAVAMTCIGFTLGIVAGCVLTCLLFVYSSSCQSAVKHSQSIDCAIHICSLQGFLFFGVVCLI